MTSYPLSAPPLSPATESLQLVRNQSVMESSFSGHTVAIEQYASWRLELTFAPQTPTSARSFLAWRDSLKGAIGTFLYQPNGSGLALSGKTLASAGNAYSDSILVGGWTASQASGLSAGHYLSISNNLFRLVSAPANATGSGQCTIFIEPSLKQTFASGTSVNFATPTVKLRLDTSTDDKGLGYSRDPDSVSVGAVRAKEAL